VQLVACFGSADALRNDAHGLELAPPRHLFARIRKGTVRHILTADTVPTATGSRPAPFSTPLSSRLHYPSRPWMRSAMCSLCIRDKCVVVQRWIVAAGVRMFGQTSCQANARERTQMPEGVTIVNTPNKEWAALEASSLAGLARACMEERLCAGTP